MSDIVPGDMVHCNGNILWRGVRENKVDDDRAAYVLTNRYLEYLDAANFVIILAVYPDQVNPPNSSFKGGPFAFVLASDTRFGYIRVATCMKVSP